MANPENRNLPPNHLTGEQTGKRNYERREDHQEGDGPVQAPRLQEGDDEEE